MATIRYVHSAMQICVFTAFSVCPREKNDLVSEYTNGLVDRAGVPTLEQHPAFCACDKESTCAMDSVQSTEIYIAAVHDVEGTGLEQHIIEIVHIVHFASSHVEKRRNRATYVQTEMELDRAFRGDIREVRKEREAQLDK